MSQLRVEVHPRISGIAPTDWDRCAGVDNPFVSHAFLLALEESRSACAETGWQPQHLTLKDTEGQVLACAPLYLKNHSYGEYVFDWSWANAFERAGGRYYPKLQCAVPFTPVTGPRLLIAPNNKEGNKTEQQDLRLALINAMLQLLQQYQASSLHLTFTSEEEWQSLAQPGLLPRTGVQYHWENREYTCFDNFLSDLSSRKRKAIRKERREANSHGLTLQTLEGESLTPVILEQFHALYLNTVDKKHAHDYLTRDFFSRLGQQLAEKVVLTSAWNGEKLVAAALNLRGSNTLYGRNWGSTGHYPSLHFELCYYQAIDYAITHGLKRVEAGAQGEHKIQRGYLPSRTYSLHAIADPNFRDAIARFLEGEQRALEQDMDYLKELGPFRKATDIQTGL
ncbi:GNAT family N-acetyltransferase [Kiloniella laminariae]|uniref:GNAT family N-acetyltransferase n=1 Tax=Kiloniella laminariae TaxID=454162 RepID=UPI0003617231|nr:GNAT family N-acetyltransferase [Kiloniella laminariae]